MIQQLLQSFGVEYEDVADYIPKLAAMSPASAVLFLSQLDEQKVRRIAVWAQAFITELNDIPNKTKANEIDKAYETPLGGSFLEVADCMKGVRSQITFEQINRATADMALSVKSDNYMDSIMTALGILKLLAL